MQGQNQLITRISAAVYLAYASKQSNQIYNRNNFENDRQHGRISAVEYLTLNPISESQNPDTGTARKKQSTNFSMQGLYQLLTWISAAIYLPAKQSNQIIIKQL